MMFSSMLKKIKNDYVQPGKGTHRVAYMYIPSNSVYDCLISNFDGLENLSKSLTSAESPLVLPSDSESESSEEE